VYRCVLFDWQTAIILHTTISVSSTHRKGNAFCKVGGKLYIIFTRFYIPHF